MNNWNVGTSDEDIDALLENLSSEPPEVTLVAVTYHRDLDLFLLRLSDGRRLAIPREDIQFVAKATPDQAADFTVGLHKVDLWWPQLDTGIYLPDVLDGRYGSREWMDHVHRRTSAAA